MSAFSTCSSQFAHLPWYSQSSRKALPSQAQSRVISKQKLQFQVKSLAASSKPSLHSYFFSNHNNNRSLQLVLLQGLVVALVGAASLRTPARCAAPRGAEHARADWTWAAPPSADEFCTARAPTGSRALTAMCVC